ncbi:MAG: DUF488 domain-containing protein [Alphaproteobacteria bacterium]
MTPAAQAKSATIFTIGHSVHALPRFLELLAIHGIALVIDTRGRPYSRWNPQYNRERFADSLKEKGVGYLWLGDSLAGRPEDKSLYGTDGKPDWARIVAAPGFARGIDRVMSEASRPVAILCAEEDPMRCHRRFLLTPPLLARGASVLHIRGDGRLESEGELCARDRRPQLELFAAS